MLRFGSALASVSRHFGKIREANAYVRWLITARVAHKLSSPNGVRTVRRINSGEDEARIEINADTPME